MPMSLVEEIDHGGWVALVLDCSERRNALSSVLVDELIEALGRAEKTARAAVISARGPVFCAGADLKEGMSLDPDRPSSRAFRALADSPLFLAAAITGGVYGAGVQLVAACPVAIGTDRAVFGLPEARHGVFPLGVVPYLEGRVPARRLLTIGMRGGVIDAAEAHACGLLTELVNEHDLPTRITDWMELALSRPEVAAQAKRWWSAPLLDAGFQRRVSDLESMLAHSLPREAG
jgi:enoyl-CoA hydratase/carnithine racemase